MSDYINKIVTVILTFVMLVVAPLLISYKNDAMLARREILNDVELFIDKVQDATSITEDDINQLYLTCNSHGLVVDVTVKRLVSAAVYDPDNNIAQTNYFAVESLDTLKNINKGDVIQVFVTEKAISTQRRATYKILGVDEGALNFSLAGVVG